MVAVPVVEVGSAAAEAIEVVEEAVVAGEASEEALLSAVGSVPVRHTIAIISAGPGPFITIIPVLLPCLPGSFPQ